MKLTSRDLSMLNGEQSRAAAMAMELVVTVGESLGANRLVDISSAHIDGCLYHGVAGMDFAESLVAGGGKVVVPTTLNVTSFDLLHPELYEGTEDDQVFPRRLMDAYVALGCEPTWTCAPYQLAQRPQMGEQIAWGESNAIVFANSVLGARTGRYGDFMDICCALTGRAPYTGLHTDEGRLATLVVELGLTDKILASDVSYPLIGHSIGKMAGNEVVAIVGLPAGTSEDRLKALGAAAASSGSVAMFHAVGVTPEAPSLGAATGGRPPRQVVQLGKDELRLAFDELDSRTTGILGAVSVGTPHMSATEMRELLDLLAGRRSAVPFYVNTSRGVLEAISDVDWPGALQSFGATLVTDTCTYISPVMDRVVGDVMTNSGKWAFYAPANLGVGVLFGSLADCVDSAVAGSALPAEVLRW
ncbi:MAG: aconitase X catalytic domain-containing protein [Actinomycetota bacterium]|nr:aconitase X catalytic domain-containing protein [Actinomycetota bacterium]